MLQALPHCVPLLTGLILPLKTFYFFLMYPQCRRQWTHTHPGSHTRSTTEKKKWQMTKETAELYIRWEIAVLCIRINKYSLNHLQVKHQTNEHVDLFWDTWRSWVSLWLFTSSVLLNTQSSALVLWTLCGQSSPHYLGGWVKQSSGDNWYGFKSSPFLTRSTTELSFMEGQKSSYLM